MSRKVPKQKGPSKMASTYNFMAPDAIGNGYRLIPIQGFKGFPGFRYHPTKGFRREAGYNPLTA